MGQRLDTVVCDCCLQQVDRMWAYRHPAFCFWDKDREQYVFQAGWWGFCIFCWTLFRNNEIHTLAARVKVINFPLDERDLEDLYSVVSKAVYGEPKPWEAGMVYDFPVEVEVLK